MNLARRTFVFAAMARVSRAAERLVTTPAELNAGIRTAKPGDMIVLRDGVWRDLNLMFTGEGRPNQPITLRAQTPGKVVLSGNSRLQIGGRYLTVEGLVFQDGFGPREVISFRTGPKSLS